MKVNLYKDLWEIKLSIFERILAIHGSFKIFYSVIVKTSIEISFSSNKEIRMPGTYFPNMIKVGTFLTERGKEFWYTTRKKEFLILELVNQNYRRIILSIVNSKGLKKYLPKDFKNLKFFKKEGVKKEGQISLIQDFILATTSGVICKSLCSAFACSAHFAINSCSVSAVADQPQSEPPSAHATLLVM